MILLIFFSCSVLLYRLDWPQCKEPLSPSMLDYVLKVVDPIRDADMVKHKLKLSDKCAVLIRLVGILLQKSVKAGISLFTVANLIVRQDLNGEEMSELEVLHEKAALKSKVDGNSEDEEENFLSNDAFWVNVDVLLDELVEKHLTTLSESSEESKV